jgi:hypothetical protein
MFDDLENLKIDKNKEEDVCEKNVQKPRKDSCRQCDIGDPSHSGFDSGLFCAEDGYADTHSSPSPAVFSPFRERGWSGCLLERVY